MVARILSRWVISLGITLASLVTITALLTQPGAQAKPAAATPCLGSIQACIDAASDGDAILIPAGTYTESLTLSKPVSVTGVNSATTIIHAVAGQRVLTVTGASISTSVVISGLTFTGGNLSSDLYCPEACGGGMLVTDGAQVTIHNAIFSNNAASGAGGGLYGGDISSVPTAVTVIDSQFVSNTAGYDGGGAASDGSIMLVGGQFMGNVSQVNGGGLSLTYFNNGGDVLITGTHFINNTAIGAGSSTAGLGGGVSVWGTVIITDGYFEGNVSHGANGGGLWAGEFIITNTDFVSNSVAGLGGGVSGSGMVFHCRFKRNSSVVAGGGLSANFALIKDTYFISNTSNITYGWGGGGGAFVVFQGEVSNARFENNQCLTTGCSGGGILLWGQSYITNALFINNAANFDGAAIGINAPGPHELSHLIIVGANFNTKPAIAVYNGTVGITNTIITSHTIAISNSGGDVYEDYNLFFGNVTNTIGVTRGGHSLSGDPRFVDPANGDYHLRFPSPAIDHGVDAGVTTDLDGKLRPAYFGFDIGAYEYQGPITHVFLPVIRK